ncbi:MAG TPA: LuxR C-terminal-related transcriptional regulator [Anaerolineales bacterium]|nr:LuxR C-terminal-related transcriptional regulator [Anaerolineales bacterium]
MATPLLHSKLMPPRPRGPLVARPGLFRRLDDGLDKKLTLVDAPTGFGKTTLVGMWLAKRSLASAWVSLDGNDNDPVRFWTYVITALRALDAEIGRTALSALSAAQPPSILTILTPLLNDLAGLPGPCVLVLEDYHAITAAEIHSALAFLVQHLPEPLHLVILSRSEPDLPLGILRARAELVEISAAELRFDRAETETFLREVRKAELPPAALDRLQEQTEGWAAGLRLAVLLLQDKDGEAAEQALAGFSGSHRFVTEYLTGEAFASQPEDIQSFLLQTCFLSRLTGALCDAVTQANDGRSTMEMLAREGLFLVRLEHGPGLDWYRYTPLFAESIQALARQRLGEAGVRAIFERASNWYAGQQLYAEAIETALAAGLYGRAIGLVEIYVEIYSLNEMRTLMRWLASIPEALTLEHPAVCLMYAQVILFSSDRFAKATARRIEPYLQAAEAAWQAAGDEGGLGAVLALRGMTLLWQGDFRRAQECVHAALKKLPESEVFWRGISLLNAASGELYAGRMLNAQDQLLEARALLGASQNVHGMLAASGMLSEIFFAQGDLEPSIQLGRQILAEAVGDESMLDDQGTARLNLAQAAYEQNDLETAAHYAAEALELGKQRANELLQAQAAARLELVRSAQGRPAEGALKALEAQLHSPLAIEELREAEALLAVRAGGTPGAWLESDPQGLPGQKEKRTFILARQRIAAGQPGEASALLAPSIPEAAANGRIHSQVEALCLEALAQHAAGNDPGALQALKQAVTIGHEKGFRRLFLDEGTPLALLLRQLHPTLNQAGPRLYVTALLHLFPPAPNSASQGEPGTPAPIEPLSQQEVRVLKLLVAGLSNGEIAGELVVSANTVKTHIKNVYRKLNVNSRDEARQVAKELRLL